MIFFNRSQQTVTAILPPETEFQNSKLDYWTNTIIEGTLKKLAQMNLMFKYVGLPMMSQNCPSKPLLRLQSLAISHKMLVLDFTQHQCAYGIAQQMVCQFNIIRRGRCALQAQLPKPLSQTQSSAP